MADFMFVKDAAALWNIGILVNGRLAGFAVAERFPEQ